MTDLSLTSAYDYDLPPELVASQPPEHRIDARMLLVGDDVGPHHTNVSALREELHAGDVLVFNNARVVPARLRAERITGGQVEIFVIGTSAEGVWTRGGNECVALLRANKSLQPGERLLLKHADAEFIITARHDGGVVSLNLSTSSCDVLSLLELAGEVPLPPYIVKARADRGESEVSETDSSRYQTVFADAPGAVAAPTAGLHFDAEFIAELEAMGVIVVSLSLLVGIGTFRPVQDEQLDEHEMHWETYSIPEQTVNAIQTAQSTGARVFAVGTTVVRALEASARETGAISAGTNRTNLFIRPGFDFRVVDALVTNFHLPKSTLLALVCALGGYDNVMSAYREAVSERYRFYSYGDCMLVHGHNLAYGKENEIDED